MTRVQGPAQVMCRVYSDHCPVTSGDHETWSPEDSSGEGGDQHMRGRDTQGHPGHSSCEVSSSLRVLMWSLKVMELNYIWDCVTPACTSHHWSSHFSNNIWHFKKYFSPFFPQRNQYCWNSHTKYICGIKNWISHSMFNFVIQSISGIIGFNTVVWE